MSNTKPAHPAPWYRKSRQRWYVTHNGTQHALEKRIPERDLAGAQDAADRLIERLSAGIAARMNAPAAHPLGVSGSSLGLPGSSLGVAGRSLGVNDTLGTVADAVASYLSASQHRVLLGKITVETLHNYTVACTHLRTTFGHRAICSLLAVELETWADRPAWSPSYQRSVLRTVQQMLRSNGIVLKVDAPHAESRGADAVLSDEQFGIVLGDLRKRKRRSDLAELLEVLRECGARPSEISRLKVDSIDWQNCSTRLREHKTRRHTGADRIIHFTRVAMAILERQKEKYAEGHLFRCLTGSAFSKTAIARRLGECSERIGFRVISYGLRHAFCSRALAAGVPDAVVAALVGHTSTTMIHKNYSHLNQNSRLLKEAVEKATKRAG